MTTILFLVPFQSIKGSYLLQGLLAVLLGLSEVVLQVTNTPLVLVHLKQGSIMRIVFFCGSLISSQLFRAFFNLPQGKAFQFFAPFITLGGGGGGGYPQQKPLPETRGGL